MVLGLSLAFVREFLDDSIKSKDLERVAPGLNVLGLVPVVDDWRSEEDAFVVSVAEPKGPTAEAYQTLRTSLRFLALEQPCGPFNSPVRTPARARARPRRLPNLAVADGGRVTFDEPTW